MKLALPLIIAVFGFSSYALAVNPTQGLPAKVANLHNALSGDDCDSQIQRGPDVHDLGKGHKLYFVPCMAGAYQTNFRVYLSSMNDEIVKPVIALEFDDTLKSVSGTLDLTDPDYNAKAKTILTRRRSGPGICGQSSLNKLVFDGSGSVTLRTTEIRSRGDCYGEPSEWPVVFRQK